MSGVHSSDNINELIREVIKEFELQGKVGHIVTYNRANFVKAMKALFAFCDFTDHGEVTVSHEPDAAERKDRATTEEEVELEILFGYDELDSDGDETETEDTTDLKNPPTLSPVEIF